MALHWTPPEGVIGDYVTFLADYDSKKLFEEIAGWLAENYVAIKEPESGLKSVDVWREFLGPEHPHMRNHHPKRGYHVELRYFQHMLYYAGFAMGENGIRVALQKREHAEQFNSKEDIF